MVMDTMNKPSFIEASLNAFFKKNFEAKDRIMMKTDGTVDGSYAPYVNPFIKIHDARRARAENLALSEQEFFDKHGFVLLSHESAVKDWDKDAATPFSDNEIAHIYLPEVEKLVRTKIMPGRKIEIQQSPSSFLRRGPGTPNPFYGSGVHQDFGLTADDYQENLEAFRTPEMGQMWRSQYERPEVEGFIMVDFWRPLYLKGPLEHMPLAVCNPNTVNVDDIVPTGLVDFSPTGKPTNQMALRFDSGQKWYYYPRMTNDEVMVFKIFQVFKRDTRPRLQSCFHSAFSEPGAPSDATERQSCEHRVGIFIMKD